MRIKLNIKCRKAVDVYDLTISDYRKILQAATSARDGVMPLEIRSGRYSSLCTESGLESVFRSPCMVSR